MSSHWENQPDFVKGTDIAHWLDSLELRFNLDDLDVTNHATRMLTILKLKIGPEGRQALEELQENSYVKAKEVLRDKFGNKASLETAIMKLSMAKVDYSPDKFGESLQRLGELICAADPNITASSKVSVISQRLSTMLTGRVQRRLLDRMGFYKSIDDLYVDLEFHNRMNHEHNVSKKFPQNRRNENSQISQREVLRCHHCNFPGHKKAQCRRFLAGLPKKDYTQKEKPENAKPSCAVSNPGDSCLKPAVVILPINGLPTKCLIDSGSAVSLISSEHASHLPRMECHFSIIGATGAAEIIKFFSQLDVKIGNRVIKVSLCHSTSSMVKDKVILGMDFLSQLKSTTISANGILLDESFFPFLESPSLTLSAAVDITGETVPLRHLDNSINVNSVQLQPSAIPSLSNEEVLSRIKERFGDEDLFSVFSMDKTDIGECSQRVPYISFDFSKVKPFRPFNFPGRMMEQAESVISEMIAAGTIEEGPAKLLHNLIPVKKRDGTVRPTTDMRRSNEAAPFLDYPVHRVDKAVQDAAGGDFYLMCDLVSSFHQFRLHPDNVGDIGLYFNYKTYRYLSLPQGFKLSPQLMQAILDKISIPGLRWYYDDAIFKTVGSLDDHLSNVRDVLLMLKKANLKISWKKSILCSASITYLGHTISKLGTQVSESASKAIENLKQPASVSDIKSLLGSIAFYCNYVPNFANRLLPITSLLKKNTPFVWSPECQKVFEELKQGLCSRNILYTEIKDLPLEVYTDASQIGFGGFIAQTVEGKQRILRYWSKKRSHTLRQRDSIFLEGMAIVLFARKHLNLLLGAKIIWHSDNLPIIKYFSKNLDTHPQLSAWATELSVLDITWKYLPGPSNNLPDSLSRLCSSVTDNDSPPPSPISPTCPVSPFPTSSPEVHVSHILISDKEEGNNIRDFNSRLIEEQAKLNLEMDCNMIKLNNIVFSRNSTKLGEKLVPVLPRSMFKEIALHFHKTLGHPGVQRTFLTIKENFCADGIISIVKDVISRCETCQVTKPSQILSPKFDPISIPPIPFTSIAGDIWQYRHKKEVVSVLSFIDLTSRMWFPDIIVDETSQSIGDSMVTHLFSKFGIPRTIRFDQQTSLRSRALSSLLESFGISVEFNTAQHHNGNSFIERSFRTLKQLLRSCYHEFVSNTKSSISELDFIKSHLSQIAFKYNSTINSSTKLTPFKIFFLRDSGLVNFRPQLDMDNDTTFYSTTAAFSNWKRIAEDSMETRLQANNKLPNHDVPCPKFNVGDLVLIKNSNPTTKLEPPFLGPYTVTKQINAHIYVKCQNASKGRP
uniref:RNA-directed DNA polymerase n=1 Tax=Strongyloides papillosus TaxID=174720 RepID=A0A0N5CFS5_STREA